MQLPESVHGADPTQSGDLEVPELFDFSTSTPHQITVFATNAQSSPVRFAELVLYDGPRSEGATLIASGHTDVQGVFRFSGRVADHVSTVYLYSNHPEIRGGQEVYLQNNNQVIYFKPSESVGRFERSLGEEICGNGLDDDGDGLFDCADPDCEEYGGCDDCFVCESGFYQRINLYFKQLDITTGVYETLLGPSSEINSLHGGYNVRDGYFYAFNAGDKPFLYQITRDSVVETDTIANFPSNVDFAADMDTSGNLVIYSLNGKMGLVNLESLSYTELSFSHPGGNISDIVFYPQDGHVYGLSSECELYRFNLSDQTTTFLGDFSEEIGLDSHFGAAWTDRNGDLFFAQNVTGKIFQIYMDSQGNPTGIDLKIIGETTSGNDGFSCPLSDSPTFEIAYNQIDDDGDGATDCQDTDLASGDYCKDDDGDGVFNALDDFPQDHDASSSSFFPGEEVFGAYAFEDQWPRKGDFDFNDLVVDYSYKFGHDVDGKISRMTATYQVSAVGAAFQIGFGLQFDGLTPDQVQSVSGTNASSVTTLNNGCESGQNKAVVIIFDNAHDLMGFSPGTIINTRSSVLSNPPYILTIEVDLDEPVDSIGGLNPFIFTKGERPREIHLKNFAPTDLATNNLWQTEDDASSGGSTYQTSTGMPWALDIPVAFTHPREEISILSAFPSFDDWVLSSGVAHEDWYLPGNSLQEKRVNRD